MPIFEKIRRIVKSNINDLLDRVEDPEKILDQLVEDMQQDLKEAKIQVAAAIRDGNKLEAQHKENQQSAEKWEKRAIVFIQNGDDARAKESLLRKRSFTDLAESYHEQLETQRESISLLKDGLATLEAKIEEAKHKRALLLARKKQAEAERTIHQTVAKISGSNTMSTFDRIQDRILDAEADTEALRELERLELTGSFFEPSSKDEIEDELAQLKAKLKQ